MQHTTAFQRITSQLSQRPDPDRCRRSPFTIAIVGAGFSGTLLAFHLSRLCGPLPVRLVLIERASRFAQGAAYSTRCPLHLLNVPAGRMSALPEAAGHFVNWLAQEGLYADPDSFQPRQVYGRYLRSLFDQSTEHFAGLEHLRGEVTAVLPNPDGTAAIVELADGSSLTADRVVLALGNLSPAQPLAGHWDFYQSPRYARDPWSETLFSGLDPQAPVLLVGSGLTMVDKVLELEEAGHRGAIFVLSRRGLMPLAHRFPRGRARLPALLPATADGWCRLLRQLARESADWQHVVDGIRPLTEQIWSAFSLQEQHRFLRHLRPYWEVHRHRIAPEVARQIEQVRTSGRLQALAGRLLAFYERADGVEVVFRPRGSGERQSLKVERVVNCTGPESRIERIAEPLIRRLHAQGLIRANQTGLGLDVTAGGALIDHSGTASRLLFTIGPLRKGCLWETTAVPELRGQAAVLARQLLEPVLANLTAAGGQGQNS